MQRAQYIPPGQQSLRYIAMRNADAQMAALTYAVTVLKPALAILAHMIVTAIAQLDTVPVVATVDPIAHGVRIPVPQIIHANAPGKLAAKTAHAHAENRVRTAGHHTNAIPSNRIGIGNKPLVPVMHHKLTGEYSLH